MARKVGWAVQLEVPQEGDMALRSQRALCVLLGAVVQKRQYRRHARRSNGPVGRAPLHVHLGVGGNVASSELLTSLSTWVRLPAH